MKPSEYRKYYLAFSNLYGCITSDMAFEIIKCYDNNELKKDFLKDIKTRLDKNTKGFIIFQTGEKDQYVIARDYYDCKELDRVFEGQGLKPFYIPDTKEELIKFSDTSYVDNMEALMELVNWFETITGDVEEAIKIIYVITLSVEQGFNAYEPTLEYLGQENINLTNEDKETFRTMLDKASKKLRTVINRGFTEEELDEILDDGEEAAAA